MAVLVLVVMCRVSASCDCVQDASVCAACGTEIVFETLSDATDALLHVIDHDENDDGSFMVSYARHSKFVCSSLRTEHWRQLVAAGMLRLDRAERG